MNPAAVLRLDFLANPTCPAHGPLHQTLSSLPGHPQLRRPVVGPSGHVIYLNGLGVKAANGPGGPTSAAEVLACVGEISSRAGSAPSSLAAGAVLADSSADSFREARVMTGGKRTGLAIVAGSLRAVVNVGDVLEGADQLVLHCLSRPV